MNNKVKFNICNCHYALQKIQENGEIGFENPVAMPGAVSIALDPNGEPESFYADGIEYYIIANNMGYDGDLELALIPESFRTDVLKEEAYRSFHILSEYLESRGVTGIIYPCTRTNKVVGKNVVLFNIHDATPIDGSIREIIY